MFPLNSNTPYIKDTGERARLGQIVGGGADTPELPDYSISDAGKVLTVGEDGSLEWDEKGAGGGDAFISYDFTKFSGSIHGVEMSENGAEFNSTSDYFVLANLGSIYDFTIYIDVGDFEVIPQMNTHRRFVTAGGSGNSSGLIWRHGSDVWAIYAGNVWVNSDISDPAFFDNSKVKIYVDASGHWHIYKNNELCFETTNQIETNILELGSDSGQSLTTGIFTGARIYKGNYTET